MAYIDKINKNNTDYDIQDSKAARSVEGDTSSHVELTNEIYTTSTQTSSAEFVYRTTAGDVSVKTGPAVLVSIKGKTIQTGHSDEVLTCSGEFSDPGTTVALDEGTWRAGGYADGTYVFTYDGSDWKLSGSAVTLTNYGVTVTGTATADDTITVAYTALVIGTLTTATPTSFVATGFNQYDATAGYAHVVGDNQYRIDGTYTSLGFTETIGGTTTAVTVTDGKFTPEADGYIYVTGASGDILIALVWSGTMDSEPFSAYEVSSITIPTADKNSTALPTASYGMPSVGDVADELNFADKRYIKNIGQYGYSAENLATVQALGVDYIYDTTNIFYVLPEPVSYELADSTSGAYVCNDYGTEEFVGTTVPLTASITYGNSLVDKLRNMLPIQSVGTGLTLTGTELSVAGGGGGMREVTSADFNWPTANPDGVATWLLSDGVYFSKATKLYFNTSTSVTGNRSFIKSTTGNGNSLTASFYGNSAGNNVNVYYTNTNGSDAWSNTIASLADIYVDPNYKKKVRLGANSQCYSDGSIVIGSGASGGQQSSNDVVIGAGAVTFNGDSNIAIGHGATTTSNSSYAICIGASTLVDGGKKGSIAFGAGAHATEQGMMDIGSSGIANIGYNSSVYRLLTGLYDPQNAHDAATKGYVDPTTGASAPTTSTAGRLGQLYIDTSSNTAYMCVNVNGSTYTWKALTA